MNTSKSPSRHPWHSYAFHGAVAFFFTPMFVAVDPIDLVGRVDPDGRVDADGLVGPAIAIAAIAVAVVAAVTQSGLVGGLARAVMQSGGKAWRGRWAVGGGAHSGTSFGWRIALLAACMAPLSRRRWLDMIAETLNDFPPDQRPVMLRDCRRHAVVVIMRSWTIDFTRSGASR